MSFMRHTLSLAAIWLAFASGCEAGSEAAADATSNPMNIDANQLVSDAAVGDAATVGASDSGSSKPCTAIPNSPPWLVSYQQEIVAKLSGADEISKGLRLTDRATAQHRSATRQYLYEELQAAGYAARLHNYGSGTNVWAELAAQPASARTIVLGAHLDSVSGSPGANDNATGVAMVLAAARYLGTVDCRQVTVLFAFFDQEEVGLIGSYQFASMLAASEYDVEAVHTIDQMGWDQDGDRAVEIERPDAGLFQFWMNASQSSGQAVPTYQTATGATDHVSFRQWNFAAVGLTEEFVNGDTTPHYHLPGDRYETVDFDYLRSTTIIANHGLASYVRIASKPAQAALATGNAARYPLPQRGHAQTPPAWLTSRRAQCGGH